MKKAFLSAFAMSLMLVGTASAQTEAIDDFLGLEKEVLPELQGPQKFTPPDQHFTPTWNVQEKEVEVDTEPLKGQSYSLIPWGEQDPEDFLDINRWLVTRTLKDKNPDWKVRLRFDRYSELVGKVLTCKGTCEVYRGLVPVKVQHLSRILEGDELHLGKDSSAWVYLMDGTLARMGANTSVSFLEINWSQEEVLHVVRLNHGHIFWHSRSPDPLPFDDAPETDAVSLPLMVRAANTENFEREIFQKQSDRGHLSEVMALDLDAIKRQFRRLEEIRGLNSKELNLRSRVMLVSPNATAVAAQGDFDFIYVLGGKSFFHKRSPHDFSLYLRGYSVTDAQTITDSSWYEVDNLGRNLTAQAEAAGFLQVTELLTKRIRTIELAREMWISDFTLPIVREKADEHKLAVHHGYALWKDHQGRLAWLQEYTRRIETTNLTAMNNLFKKLEEGGKKISTELTSDHYAAALNHYLLGLKSRYTEKKMMVRQMSDVQYYVWVLRNAKP